MVLVPILAAFIHEFLSSKNNVVRRVVWYLLVAIEVGMHNGAMATGLAKGMGLLGTTGLAAVIFAPLMNVTGSLRANYWRKRPIDSRSGRYLSASQPVPTAKNTARIGSVGARNRIDM